MAQIERTVTLCCSATCPKLTVDTEAKTVNITDDYGGSVLLTLQEFELAYKQYMEITAVKA